MSEETSDTIGKVKEAAEIASTFQKTLKSITSIASSDAITNIIRVVAMLFLGIGWFLLKKRLTKILVEKARQLSEHEKEELRQYLASIQEGSDDSIVTDLEAGF